MTAEPERGALPLQNFAERTVPDLLDRSRQFGLDRPILITTSPETMLGYGEFLARVAGAAVELSRRFEPGTRVACLLSNTVDYMVLRYALSCAALIEVAINGEHKKMVLHHMLEIAGPAAVIVTDAYRAHLEGCGFDLGTVQIIDERALARMTRSPVPWEDRPRRRPQPRDAARILFTSGTSGRSKAVEISHAYEVYAGERHVALLDLGVADRWLYVTPLFHIDAIYIFSILLHTGGALALSPRFSASRFWQEVETAGATYLCYVGSILAILLKGEDRARPTPLRYAVGGGATREQIEEFERRFGVCVLEAYAMTEAICCTFSTVRDRRPGSTGRPISGYEVKILDESGNPLPSGSAGEIAVRAEEPCAMFTRYFRDEAATAEAGRGGWFHTGDLGACDDEGYFYFRGRIKDAIRVRGENVSAAELEAIADSHPQVEASAAVAVAAELGEDEILLYVEIRNGAALPGEELFAFLESRAAKFMLPRYIKFVAELPRTPTHKIQKSDLDRTVPGGAWIRSQQR